MSETTALASSQGVSSSMGKNQVRRVLLGTSVGTTLEFFDFLLYGALAGIVFPHVFFPASDPSTAILQSFATFGVGFLARPIGAAFFARVTDRIGRKPTMVVTLMTMGLASLAIGLLPGYATWGVLAPTLLVFLRFVQGFALGGEASSACIIALEYAPDDKRGLFGAIVNLGNPGGQVLLALMLLGAGLMVGEDALRDWAWRVPFIIGALMAVLGYFIRRHMDESPLFLKAQAIGAQTKTPLKDVFKGHWRTVLRLALVWAPNTACSYVVTAYALSYINNNLGMSKNHTFGLLLVLMLCGLVLVPLGGVMSDRYGRRPLVLACLATSIAGLLVFFQLLDTKSLPLMFLAMLIVHGANLTAVGAMAALFAEPFPVSIRYSGHASIYTLNNLVAGGPAPFVAAGLLALTGTTWSIVILLISMYVLAFILLATHKETRWAPFRDAL